MLFSRKVILNRVLQGLSTYCVVGGGGGSVIKDKIDTIGRKRMMFISFHFLPFIHLLSPCCLKLL